MPARVLILLLAACAAGGCGDGKVEGRERDARFEEGQADDELLRVPFSYDTDNRLPGPVALVSSDLPVRTFYRCE